MRAIVAALILAAAACGPKHGNQCPGTSAGKCLFGEKCTFDQSRGCNVCVCEPPSNDSNPRDPDDPTNPNPPMQR
jgi:hypothetical protein